MLWFEKSKVKQLVSGGSGVQKSTKGRHCFAHLPLPISSCALKPHIPSCTHSRVHSLGQGREWQGIWLTVSESFSVIYFLTYGLYYKHSFHDSLSRYPRKENPKSLRMESVALCVLTEVALQIFSSCLMPVSKHPAITHSSSSKTWSRASAFESYCPIGIALLRMQFWRGEIFLPTFFYTYFTLLMNLLSPNIL